MALERPGPAPVGRRVRLRLVSEVIDGTVEGDEEQAPVSPVDHPDVQAPLTGHTVTSRAPAGDLVRTQAAAVAVTGFAVGAVTAVALSRRRTRKAAKRAPNKRGLQNTGVVASRSFLVDVHLLGHKD